MKVKELNKVDDHELTPPYARYRVHLIRPCSLRGVQETGGETFSSKRTVP